MTETTERIFRVPEWRKADTDKRLIRLAKKAAKLGTPLISWDWTGEESVMVLTGGVTVDGGSRTEYERPKDYVVEPGEEVLGLRTYKFLTVSGEAPRLAGWRFRGTIVHAGEAGNLLKTLLDEGEQVPEEFRTRSAWCDHCQLNRLRNDTFLVESEDTGEWKQVGRQCLRDFLGHESPERIAAYAEMLADLLADLGSDEDWEVAGAKTDPVLFVPSYLAHVAQAIERFGWVSRKDAGYGGNATADAALKTYYDRRAEQPESRYQLEADEALEWVRSLEDAELDNDFLWNLHVATVADWVTDRAAGILAAVFIAKKVRDEADLRKSAERDDGLDEWFGTEKKRETFELEVTFTMVIEGYYGTKQLVKLRDVDGREAVWFNSGETMTTVPQPQPEDGAWVPDEYVARWEVGQKYKVKATVKSHGLYEDRKQTVLTRVTKV